jgi:hypothetical protein
MMIMTVPKIVATQRVIVVLIRPGILIMNKKRKKDEKYESLFTFFVFLIFSEN